MCIFPGFLSVCVGNRKANSVNSNLMSSLKICWTENRLRQSDYSRQDTGNWNYWRNPVELFCQGARGVQATSVGGVDGVCVCVGVSLQCDFSKLQTSVVCLFIIVVWICLCTCRPICWTDTKQICFLNDRDNVSVCFRPETKLHILYIEMHSFKKYMFLEWLSCFQSTISCFLCHFSHTVICGG